DFNENREYLPVQYPLNEALSLSELISRIEAVPGVKAALPRISTYASLFDSTVKHALVWGIDFERELQVNHFNLSKQNSGIVEGRFPIAGSNECAIGYTLAKKLGLHIGDRISFKMISAQYSDKFANPQIVGIFNFDYIKYDENVIIMPFDRLAKILVMPESTQQLYIYLDKYKQSGVIKAEVKEILGPHAFVQEWREHYWIALMNSYNYLFVIIFAVFQIVASFLIINTILMVIHERIKEIGMMGALGFTRWEIVRTFFYEALYLSVLGSLAGAAVGGILTWIVSLFPLDFTFFTGGGMKDYPIAGTIFLTFSPLILLQGFFFGVLISACCTLIPSLKSAFVEPVEALRR
ncbi:MAG: FtsX-like permease family protein, partial [Treponema sp.]|nr:FtsX-like permease family protein [Treponema sp.]